MNTILKYGMVRFKSGLGIKMKKTKNPKTIIDELFPVYGSSHLSFFGDSLLHADQLKDLSSETLDVFPGIIDNLK